MLSNPIFIVGTERSGSNLLRLMLNQHSRIAIPHPPHIMRDMAGLESQYGDLTDANRFHKLATDVAQLVNMHFAPWPFLILADELISQSKAQTLYGLYAALYDLYAKHSGKARWGCKSTFMYQQIESILKAHSQPKFIHLVRDPRDVAVSAGGSIFSRFHPFSEAQLWSEQQLEIEGWREHLGTDHYLRVRYEDLTAQPETELKHIMNFLGEQFDPAQIEFHNSGEARNLARLSQSWQNVQKPTSTKSVGQYRARLNAQDLSWVESEAWDLMKIYGYSTENERRPTPPNNSQLFKISIVEFMQKWKVESKALFFDRNFKRRWRRRFYLSQLSRIEGVANGTQART